LSPRAIFWLCSNILTTKFLSGAIVGIVIAIPAILIILGAAVFFCRKQQQDKE
jgi:hypothetical protein